jgi:hypothetical protein
VKSYKLQNRIGDNAPMMRLELVDKKSFVKEDKIANLDKTDKKDDKLASKAVSKPKK